MELTSSTGPTLRHLMSQEQRMLKVKLLLFIRNIMEPTRNGRYSILTKKVRKKPRDSIKTLDSRETNHSISDPDFQ